MSGVYEYGGNSISSIDEYLDRINKMHRTPTMIVQDFSEAPHASYRSHPPNSSSYPQKHNDHRVKVFHDDHQQHQHQAPEVHKKVQFIEYEERVEVDRRGKNEVCEERTIDMEADGFIQRRHKNFEQCKTFNGY